MFARALLCTGLMLSPGVCALDLDERPALEGEFGYRPVDGRPSETNPPGFVWRPTEGASGYELELAPESDFSRVAYRATGLAVNVHCPPRSLLPGPYGWRYRAHDAAGRPTGWSGVRTFSLAGASVELPMPPRDELLARVPKDHPRLFVRPEQMPALRERARGDLAELYAGLKAAADKLMAEPPPTAEPPKYPDAVVRGSEEWRQIWWGNRTYTQAALNGAATLAFTWLLDGNEGYGQLARRILMDCIRWDPKGASGYRYNDEAGMPYNWGVSRTYTFVYPLLTAAEREACRAVMKVRGDEMMQHLFPRLYWRPYDSHANRAWHKLGEIGIAFLGEVDGAEDWVYAAAQYFFCVYPVWCDDDGGWHEGISYWSSYMARFTWWADVMRAAMGIDAFDKPYFSRVGYYPLYLMPPNMADGGFGDLVENQKSRQYANLVGNFAAQAGNGHWQWWVARHGDPKGFRDTGYVGFVRGARPAVAPQEPVDLPTSRLFRGIGQAVLNSTLHDAGQGVQLVFKSSPFGTQSHGYEANNSFVLWGYGQRLLIRTGRRDTYGSDHHRNWMWSTRSVNNLTVDGYGQVPHSSASRGAVVGFQTTGSLDGVAGEAGAAYRVTVDGQTTALLERYTRTVLFAKPDLVVVYDRLRTQGEPRSFQYWLHALNEIQVPDQHRLLVQAGEVCCAVDFLAPAGLAFTQTNQYDPNPRPRVTVREWHLTASLAAKSEGLEFVALYRPYRVGQEPPREAELAPLAAGYRLRVKLADGELVALLPTAPGPLTGDGLATDDVVVAARLDGAGTVRDRIRLDPLP